MAEVDRQTKATLTEVDEGRKELRGMMSGRSASLNKLLHEADCGRVVGERSATQDERSGKGD